MRVREQAFAESLEGWVVANREVEHYCLASGPLRPGESAKMFGAQKRASFMRLFSFQQYNHGALTQPDRRHHDNPAGGKETQQVAACCADVLENLFIAHICGQHQISG